MAQSAAVVRGTLSASAAGTSDFTKPGFGSVSAAIIIVCAANTTNNPQDDAVLAIGFWDGTNQRVCAFYDQDNVATTATTRGSEDTRGVLTYEGTGESRYTISAITDGIRFTLVTDATAVERYATVLMLAGVSAKALTFTPSTTQDATANSASLGFAPKLVLFSCIGAGSAKVAMTTASAILSFGFAADDATHRMFYIQNTNAAADATCVLGYSETRAVGQMFAWTGEVSAFNADTFTMTTRDAASGSDVCFALALGGDVSFDTGSLSTPTSTGEDAIATDIAADAVLAVLTTAKSTTIEADADANGIMIGAADDNGQYSHTTYVEDGAATTNTGSVASATALINLDTSSGGARADLIDATVALNQTNIALTYTAVAASACKGFWIAFGNPPDSDITTIWGRVARERRARIDADDREVIALLSQALPIVFDNERA